jgi:hypothetical protein
MLSQEIILLSLLLVFLWSMKAKLHLLSETGNYFFLLCILAVNLIIVAVKHEKRNSMESFTPRVREMYRPYLRDARIYTEGLISTKRDDFNRLYRQFGLS